MAALAFKPLPQRPPRAPRLSRPDGTGVGAASQSDHRLRDEAEFMVPEDFPYKKESESEEVMELDPLTSKVLDDELQNIMIKVWQALPDKAPTEAEQAVADRLRNEAGDDLRNILGLNVTKRLLNTFNPLMVKVDFNEKPDGESFRSFLKWLGCVAMKRVPPRAPDGSVGAAVGGAGGAGGYSAGRGAGAGGIGQHTYVAQLRKVADLDRVCKRANVRIRELKAKITPCYNFTKCPPNLKTVYMEPEKKTIDKTAIEPGADAQKENSTNKVEPPQKAQTNEVNKKDNEPIAPNVQVKQTEHEFKKPEVPKLHKTSTKVAKAAKAGQAKAAEKPVSKSHVAKTAQTKPATPVKTNEKAAATKAPPAKPIAGKVTTTESPTKPEKAANSNKNVSPKVVTPKTAAKKAVPKPKPITTKVAPTKITKKAKPRKQSDFDELDDEDILALMSNAIVLDEC